MAEKDFNKMTFGEKMKWLSDNMLILGFSLIVISFVIYFLMIINRKGG
jgi:hypothetical protein